MKKLIRISFAALLLLGLVIGKTYSITAPSHLKYFGFYLVNTGIDDPNDAVAKTNYDDEVGYWTNMNQTVAWGTTQNISADVTSASNQCTKPFMSIEQLFWQLTANSGGSSPSGRTFVMYPDWQARWNTFKSTNAASLTPEKIGCFYICDEPFWSGIPNDQLKAVCDLVKADFPNIPTFYIEAYNQISNMVIPTTADWVGFDQYDVFSPNTDQAYKDKLTALKNKRTNNQKIIIIADTHWIPLYGSQGVTTTAMSSTIQSYYDLAASDNDVIGILGYEWPGGFDGTGSLGARNFPTEVVNLLISIGQAIKANYSPCSTTSTTPSVPIGLGYSNLTQTSFTLSWSASTASGGIAGYDIAKNGAYYGGSTTTSLNITGLTCGTTYNMTVDAFSGTAGNYIISAASSPLSVKTSDCASATPSVPTGLGYTNLTQNSFTLTWSPSTASGGIAGYDIAKNGAYYGGSTTTSLNITGLTCGTTYNMTVDAFSGTAGNYIISAASSPLSVTTSACAATNILQNPGFESGTTNWWGGGCTLTAGTTYKYLGTNGVRASARTASWGGPFQTVTSGISSGGSGNYYTEAYVKMNSGSTSVRTTIHYKYNNTDYWVGTSNITVGTSWTKVSGTLNVNFSGTLQLAELYIETNTGTTTFYADECWLSKGTTKSALIESEIADITTAEIEIYPNPASSKVTITNVPDKAIIAAFTMDGKMVSKIKADNGNTNIDVSAWNKGLYLFQIQSENGMVVKKVIVE